MAEFSIKELFERAFLTDRGKPYDGNQLNEGTGEKIEYTANDDGASEGTEFLTVREETGAKLPDGRAIFMPVELGGVLLPNEPTVSFSKRKIIVKTGLVGSKRNGSVKELIRSDDWEITIRGIAVNHQSTQFYPEDDIKALRDLDRREESLTINSALTSLLGIYNVVIESFRLTEMVGIQHAQAYEFRCISDEDFILNIE